MKLWNYSLKALRIEGLFPEPRIVGREGTLRGDIDAGLKLLGSAQFFGNEEIFGQAAEGNKGTELCPPKRSTVLQLLCADAV